MVHHLANQLVAKIAFELYIGIEQENEARLRSLSRKSSKTPIRCGGIPDVRKRFPPGFRKFFRQGSRRAWVAVKIRDKNDDRAMRLLLYTLKSAT